MQFFFPLTFKLLYIMLIEVGLCCRGWFLLWVMTLESVMSIVSSWFTIPYVVLWLLAVVISSINKNFPWRATWHAMTRNSYFLWTMNDTNTYTFDTNAWILHEYYINKYIPLRYLVRYNARVTHEVYTYFLKQSGYKSLIFLAYLVLLPPYYQIYSNTTCIIVNSTLF